MELFRHWGLAAVLVPAALTAVRRAIVLLLIMSSISVALLGCHVQTSRLRTGPLVLMRVNGLVREGSLEECIASQITQGLSLKQAIQSCELKGLDLDDASWIPMGDITGRTSPAVKVSACAMIDSEPRGRGLDARDFIHNLVEAWKNTRDSLIEQRDAATSPDQRDALQGEIDTISRAISDLWEQWHQYAGDDSASTPSPPGDYPEPDPNDPTPARTAGDMETLCVQVSTFIGECNRDGWRDPQCRDFFNKMKGCGDPSVTDPSPDEPQTCGLPEVDPETAHEVMMLLCMSRKKPAPGEDPCNPIKVHGDAHTYVSGRGPHGDPCSDPAARTTDEACLPSFTLIRFGETDLAEIARFGLEKLGGPIFIVPVGPPTDDTPTPPGPTPPH